MKTHVILNWLVCSLVMISLGSCGGDHGGGGEVYPTTSVTLSVSGASAAAGAKAPFLGTYADVNKVTVVISGKDKYGVDQDPLTTADLTKGADGVWSAVVPDLPVGPALTFTARGYDASNEEIFSGVTVQTLTGTADTVTITMSPVSSGGEILFPIISSITVPSEIVVSTDAAVSIAVTGSPDENLAYAVTSGGGMFNPAAGTIALPSSANGTLNTTYTAPASPGTLNHTVKLTNSQGNSVESDFSTNIVYSKTTSTLTIGFAPVVTEISAKRTGNQVAWTVTASDDKALSLLTYAWSFDQTAGTTGAAFSAADANPGILSGYDQTVAGAITLTVTDGDGLSTVIDFALEAGQFPDVVVNPVGGLSLEGVWFIDSPDEFIESGNPTTMYVVVGPGSSGTLTDVGGFYNGPGIGSYQVLSSSAFTLTIADSRPGYGSTALTCTLSAATSGTCTDGAAFTAPIRKISNPGACAGTWSGHLTATGGTPDHTFAFEVDSSGLITMYASSTYGPGPGSNRLYCDGTEAIGFIRTSETNAWNQIRIDAPLVSGSVISGNGFEIENGCSGGVPNICSDGTVSLTKSSGYSLATLGGYWLLDHTAADAGYELFIGDGFGEIVFNSFFSMPNANTYTVQPSGDFTLHITESSGGTFDITGTLTSNNTGTYSNPPGGTIGRVTDISICQGAWSGTLSVSGVPQYDVAFTIEAGGWLDTSAVHTITPAGGGASASITNGVMVGQGSLCVGYFETSSAEPYNAFRINGTITAGSPATMSGLFDNDSGLSWPVGTVSLIRE